MSHSTEIRIKIGAFISNIDVSLHYGSRQPSEAFGVQVGKTLILTDYFALNALDCLQVHVYKQLMAALLESGKDARNTYDGQLAENENWMTVEISHFD